jgi:hypothetical protein
VAPEASPFGANRLCRPHLLRPGPTRLERARARGHGPGRGALSAALAMAEAPSKSRLAVHARVQLARVLEAAGDADTAETLYGSVVEWSQTPRPRQVRELLLVVLAGSPGRRRCGPGAAGGSPRGRRGRQPPGPRHRDGSARPRLARRATSSGCGDLNDAAGAGGAGGVGGCAGRGPGAASRPVATRG